MKYIVQQNSDNIMKTNKLLHCLLFIGAFIITSCTSYKSISIDYLRPPKHALNESIKSVGIINMTNTDSLEINYTDRYAFGSILVSTTFDADEATREIAQGLADNNIFDEVILSDKAWENKHMPTALQIDSMRNSLNVDAIVALTGTRLDWANIIFDTDFYNTADVITSIIYQYNVSIAYKDRTQNITVKDSLEIRDLYPLVIDDQTLMVDIDQDTLRKTLSGAIGYEFARNITPTWHQADRIIFTTSSQEMKDAEMFIKENNWEEAFDKWMLLTHDRSSVLKAQAQFNIALYHEMKDNLQEAVRWINAAENTLSKDKDKFRASNTYTLIEQYKQALRQREEDMKGIENYYNKKTASGNNL